MFLLEIAVIVLFVLSSFVRLWRRRRQHPPGPLGFPVLGMLPFKLLDIVFPSFSENITDLDLFKAYKEKYGPIWSVEYGKQRIVTLSSWSLINEAFIENGELFSGRPTHDSYKMVTHGRGILFTDGEMWRGSRLLALRSLRELGMGSRNLEARISEEANDLMSHLEETSSDSIKLLDAFTKGVANVITRLVFNKRNEYDDPAFATYGENLRVVANSDRAIKNATFAPVLFKIKFMKKLYPEVQRFLTANEYCYQYIRKNCEAKLKTYSKDDSPDCVFDYFQRYRFLDSSPISAHDQFEESFHSVFDLFNAGVDSTSNLLSFCCLMLGKHQDVQMDLRKELAELAVDSSQIDMKLRKSCPKMLSFIDEVHRFCSIIPKVHHRVVQECIFHGYRLHPDDIIFGDFANVFSDPNLFDNPDQFNAYRFMDESKTKYCPSKYLFPFGLGKRSCLGESIAITETFIFLGRIIYRFKISLPEGVLKSFDYVVRGHSGIVHGPTNCHINFDIL